MSRALPSGLATHLAGETTSLATLWTITRTDGVVLRFTDHDRDITFGGNVYTSAVGYDRTNIANNATLAVDSMDVRGILDSKKISELDLRGGRYDYAEVRVSAVNWSDPAAGEVKLRRGWLGEIVYSELDGTFTTELRGLAQAYAQNVVEHYSQQCRADLGDARCTVPIWPAEIKASTAYKVGDHVRVRTAKADLVALAAPGEADANDDSQYAASGTLGSNAVAADTTFLKHRAGNFRLSPAAPTENPLTAYVQFADAAQYTIGLEPFTIEGWFLLDSLDSVTGPALAGVYTTAGNQRAWLLWLGAPNEANAVNSNRLHFQVSGDGSFAGVTFFSAPFVPVLNRWYHVAVSRDEQYALRLFVDGKQLGDTKQLAVNIHNSTGPLRLGALNAGGGNDRAFDGSIEDFRMVIGDAIYRKDFTPPAAALAASFTDTLNQPHDYQDTRYTCTVAGTTPSSGSVAFPPAHTPVATGAVQLDVAANNQFSRPSGSFLDDGFKVNMRIETAGFANAANNGKFAVTAATATTLTVSATSLVVETGSGDETMTAIAKWGTPEFSINNAWRIAAEVVSVVDRTTFRLRRPSGGGLLKTGIFLNNGGAETGDLTGWTLNFGTVVIITAPVTEGGFAFKFSPDTITDSEIQQLVDVSAWAPEIDAGGKTFTTTWDMRDLDGFPSNTSAIVVDYDWLDTNKAVISSTAGGLKTASAGAYETESQTNTMPAGTRFVRLRMECETSTGGNVAVDNIRVSTSLVDSVHPNDWFNYGVLTFVSGLNAGLSVEVKDFVSATKDVTLYLPAPFDITIGDRVALTAGCDKELSTCRDKFNNVINFRGFPFVPGDDEFLRYPDSPY